MIPTNTHILYHEFDYLEPTTLDQALTLLAQYGDDARPIAGGTDLLVQMKMERKQPAYVVALNKIPELKRLVPLNYAGIRDSQGLAIGTTTSIRALHKSLIFNHHYTALAAACNWFSTVQIMNMATLGGNLCNASPAADTAPPLLVFDTRVQIASRNGTRTLPLTDFFVAPGKTVLGPDELLTTILVPPMPAHTGSGFVKIARVVADISKVCAAARITREGNRIRECRIALGSVAPTPVRATQAEALLVGQPFTPELAEHAGQIAAREINPITDVRSTREYRQQVTAVIVRDALEKSWERTH